MRLSVTLGLASLALAALATADHALERRSERARRAGVRVERLVDPARKTGVTVAALTLVIPGRPELVYARSRGQWRCMSAFGAPAALEGVQGLLASFLDARGVVRGRTDAAAATFGLAEGATLVRFHGPKILSDEDRDVLFAFEVGTSVPGGAAGRAFVRAVGTEAILEIDHDPARWYAWPADQAFPPLLDARLLAGAWPGGVRGFERVFVDLESGASLQLERQPDTGAEEGTGVIGTWIARSGTEEASVLPYRLGGFLNFLVRAPFTGLADPRDAASLGLDPPFARVTIFPAGAEPLELAVGRPSAEGAVFVANGTSGALLQTSAESARLLAPDLPMMCDPKIPNPWEAWLSR